MDPATAALLGQGFQSIGQARSNAASRKFAEQMYYKQREDALDFWNQQNEYNSPQAQMQRLKEAGVNPLTLYAKGGSGMASSQADQIPVPDKPAMEYKNPAEGLGGTAGEIFNIRLRKAQANNVKDQGNLYNTESLLKMQQIQESMARMGKDLWFTKKDKLLFRDQADALKLSVQMQQREIDKKIADTKFTVDENTRQNIMIAPTYEKAIVSIIREKFGLTLDKAKENQIYQAIKESKARSALLAQDLKWMKDGVTRNDNLVFRMLSGDLRSIVGTLQGYGNFWQNALNVGKTGVGTAFKAWKQFKGFK